MKKIVCILLVLLLLAGCGEDAAAPKETQPKELVATLGGEEVTFQAWEGEGLPASGNYFLTADVELENKVTVEGDLKLHLNGHTVLAKSGIIMGNMFLIPAGATMTVYDEVLPADFMPEYDPEEREAVVEIQAGTISSNRSFSGCMTITSIFRVEGKLTLAGGHVDASQMNIEDRANGMVAYVADGGDLQITGGVITGGTTWSFLEELGEPVNPNDTPTEPASTDPNATEPVATEPAPTEPVATEPVATEPPQTVAAGLGFGYGGVAYVDKGGQCTVSGGVIWKGSAAFGGNFYVAGDEEGAGLLTITGGTIIAGEATRSGGNICADGKLEITGGELRYGRSYGHGGNIFLTGQLNMTGGTLLAGACDANAVANKRGGNLAVNGLNATVNITNAQILDGTAACKETHGGNVAAFGYGAKEFTIGEGTVITGGLGHRGGNLYIGHFNKDVPEENMDYVFSGVTLGGGTTTYRGANMCSDTKDTTRPIQVTFNDCNMIVDNAGERSLAIGAGAKDVSQCIIVINGGTFTGGEIHIYGSSTVTSNGTKFVDCPVGGTGIYTENP